MPAPHPRTRRAGLGPAVQVAAQMGDVGAWQAAAAAGAAADAAEVYDGPVAAAAAAALSGPGP